MNARTTALSALIAMRRQNAWGGAGRAYPPPPPPPNGETRRWLQGLLYGVVQNRMLLDFYLAAGRSVPADKIAAGRA